MTCGSLNDVDVDVDVDVEEIRAQTNNCLYARS